ncbi:MAG: phosphoglycerate dehydrogenase [Chloroflexi bacterium]|uniref:D-3-phosphoglycerate dehydrogenase n=1 Tax=Candidatus Chlorohelix allophototropha TaxID=3003348 RepID=A0A8T7M006_9CHLR|nr:phosphoglycerate dehydrogenase [Chloroflexota bacterium]WJW66500.1 phosphoglycerate dehydrogenase [Chloroflexota bacterium L227-S17]
MFKVLVSDPIAKEGIARLQTEAGNIQVDVKTGLPKEELLKIISQYDGLIVRSETKVTAEVLKAATRLKVVARAGVGIDNVDVEIATERGVIVVNTPGGNTIAAAELAFTLMLAISRKLALANNTLKGGKWERKQFVGVELMGKTLGIVGLGRIGTEIARRAIAFGMKPLSFDPFVLPAYAEKIGIEMVPLEEIYSRADFITVHTPLTPETHHMVGKEAFAKMKDGVRIINAARGGIIDEDALYDALNSGKVAAAGLDVFEQEPPPSDYKLSRLDNVIVTPHLGASSEEAQVKVAVDAAESVIAALNGELVPNAVNLPGMSKETLLELRPYMLLAEKLGRLATALSDGILRKLEITVHGEKSPNNAHLLTAATLMGLLKDEKSDEPLNLVNAGYVAERRGLEIIDSCTELEGQYSGRTISLKVQSDGNGIANNFEGSVINGEPRIVRINGFPLEVAPLGYLLVSRHNDRPGIIGKVGTMLGEHDINIASMDVGRRSRSGEAVMILSIDDQVPATVVESLSKVDGMQNLRFVNLG